MKKIEIFNRHCFFSDVSTNKCRPNWFSREKCFLNLKKTINPEISNLNIVFDNKKGKIENYFLKNESNVIQISCGTEAQSFVELLKIIIGCNFEDDTIIYIVEDDYIHLNQWDKILIEGFEIGFDYLTLYDHFDKYTDMYNNLVSKILISKSTHWRTIPSTTNTYAMKFKTLKRDFETHIKYSTNVHISLDHNKFLDLNCNNKYLGSPIPGFSTHVETQWISPIINWQNHV